MQRRRRRGNVPRVALPPPLLLVFFLCRRWRRSRNAAAFCRPCPASEAACPGVAVTEERGTYFLSGLVPLGTRRRTHTHTRRFLLASLSLGRDSGRVLALSDDDDAAASAFVWPVGYLIGPQVVTNVRPARRLCCGYNLNSSPLPPPPICARCSVSHVPVFGGTSMARRRRLMLTQSFPSHTPVSIAAPVHVCSHVCCLCRKRLGISFARLDSFLWYRRCRKH